MRGYRSNFSVGGLGVVLALAVSAAVGASTFTEQFLEAAGGVRIRVLDSGPAPGQPSLLFVPGWTLTAEIWQAQLEHFAGSRRSVAMDPRGQGGSSQTGEGLYPAARARDIRAVIQGLGLEPVVLVGWSMAVKEVLSYVDQFGTSGVAALVLVDGVAGLDWDEERAHRLLDSLALLLQDQRAWTANFVPSMFRSPHSAAFLAQVQQASLRTPAPVAVALSVASLAADLRPVLGRVDRPTLIVVTPGPFAPRYAEMHAAIGGSRLEVFENAGHALFVDEPARFNSLLEEFMAALPAGR
ncbi:MAG: alpha/beta hydrolase [Thermoanaerobaculaceae bacterium]|nr:alpha/beta hydrolase [Thermoanaerobaculaceae bacterium]